jgi:hypothetical protein
MARQPITIAVEGDLDDAVARRVLGAAGLFPGDVYGRQGKNRLDKAIDGYNRAALHRHWLVLRDLDRDAACAPQLVHRLLPQPSPKMCFRVVVRMIEAWLLADRASVAQWLGVSVDVIPQAPEALEDAKATLVQLAGRSRSRALREAMVPIFGTHAKVGPGYTGETIKFVTERWQPMAAALNSPALARCLRALAGWKSSPLPDDNQ